MEIAACNAYAPDWHRWTSFGLERSAAFETDSLSSTRSVEYEVRSPADCEGMQISLTNGPSRWPDAQVYPYKYQGSQYIIGWTARR